MTESHVDRVVAARMAAARQKVEAKKRAREELAEARRRGLAQRHAQKLAHLHPPTGNVPTGQQEQAVAPAQPTGSATKEPAQTSTDRRSQ
ncbi:hypothetical protein [Streptomyces lavendulae]|uniref:hypothetical protein n=1 Tax=Streptomyces lavendulae TaxID=1914 RepID=UPI0024A1D236|nr:hypothetical protein [Streptomyces lavendulae]GLW00894.1 hypothetical protein Slala05_45250 [Streptomyces lavendulae subsp. lavendulae]